ncbi:Hypothetical predicted protein, partial [Pelobates cultripes]
MLSCNPNVERSENYYWSLTFMTPGGCSTQPAENTHTSHKFIKLLEFDLYDSWRVLNPTSREYTHFSQVYKTHSRIDYILLNAKFLTSIKQCRIDDITWSDHAPVTLTLHDKFHSRGTATWRLNYMLLEDESFQETLTGDITRYFEVNCTPQMPPHNIWLAHKAVIRGLLINRAAYLKRHANRQYMSLLKTLRDQTATHLLSPSTEGQ